MTWTPCECGEYWCTEHQRHAFECDCPPVEEWDGSPYKEDPMTHTTTTDTTEALHESLVLLWYARSGGRDAVIVPDGDGGFDLMTRTSADLYGLYVLCDAANDGTWGDTDLDDYDDGRDFADMAFAVFGNDLLAKVCK